jgi:hypothetical protein
MSAAERKRRERKMKDAGKVFIRFWTDEVDLVVKCDAMGTLDPNLADDPKALSEGTRRLVESIQIGVARDISR